MKAVVKADFYDRDASLTRKVGDVFDATDARIKEINASFPGTVEKVATKKPAPRKQV